MVYESLFWLNDDLKEVVNEFIGTLDTKRTGNCPSKFRLHGHTYACSLELNHVDNHIYRGKNFSIVWLIEKD